MSILDALQDAGDVGRDLLAVDWDRTPLGAPEQWPRSLSTIVQVMVTSRFSMWMAWGPELTFFCNDAYRRDTLGTKYPWALGRPASEVWAEIWDDIGPRIEAVLKTGVATWDESLLLFLERSGYVEETYHTFSYSPLTDDAGTIVGMLCVVSEDTERVIGERRMATLRDLGSETTTGRDEGAYLQAAALHLEASHRSLPFTMIYLLSEDGSTAELAQATGIAPGHAAAPLGMEAHRGKAVWPVAEVARGRTVVVRDLEERFSDLPTGGWDRAPSTAVVMPLPQQVPGEPAYGFLVVGVNRYRPLDEDYRSFVGLIAAQLAAGIATTRAYEAERRRAEELAELDAAKTAFFTNVSHELRTPLTLLLGPAEDALVDAEQALPGPQRHRIEIIARNGERLLKLVNTLLDFSRLESGQTPGSFEPVELGHYTAELASMFDSAVERAGLDFSIDCPPLSEPVYVDREMWAKVVMNLLSNALKFTFSGSISVSVSGQNGFARLAVADTGIGIPPAEQARLFERFHRVLGARARTHEGSGIGLALVAELAKLHGGQASVDSTPGQGSTFTVEIPFGREHLPSSQLSDEPRDVSIEREVAGFLAEASRWLLPEADSGSEAARREREDRPRVLIVDDNADMRDYLAGLLADGYSVRTASDGVHALELARVEPPDLVLTDVMMPRLDGFGLLSALHADPATLHIPVVMLSARAGEEGVIEGLEAGADDYLIKPFSARELRARVRANLELDRARRTRDQLELSQRMQSQAERLSEVGSWEIDLVTGLMRGSDQLLRMLRMTRGEFTTLHYSEVLARRVHPEDLESVRGMLSRASADRRPFENEIRVVHDDGSLVWMRIRGEVVGGEVGGGENGGEPLMLRGFIQDITRRREAEQAIATAAAAREAAEREHKIADALQRSLLPAERFESEHLEVATYYQAGVEGTRVGGDWYDAIALGAGRTALVVGDVAGRGVRAASLMGQLRAAVRAYARLDLPPAEVLELLDAIVFELGGEQLVTCIYGVYDPPAGELLYANAGHLPPLLAVPGSEEVGLSETTVVRLPGATGPPLGVGGGALYDEHRVAVPKGAIIAFYTDGLVERRDRDLDAGIDRLAAELQGFGGSVAGLPSALISALAPEGSDDDIAILVARAGDQQAQQTAVLEVPPDPAALSNGRRFAATTLAEWALPPALVDDATLIVSELLTNAVLHGNPPIRLRLRRTRRELTVEVDDESSAMPRKLRAGPNDLHGRGLAIVATIGNRWAARPNGHGKTVWSSLPITG